MPLVTRVQTYLRANARLHAEPIEAPGFTVFVSPTDEGPEESYAMPTSPAAITLGSLVQVEAILTERQRRPAVSSVEGYAPGLGSALAKVGYHEHARKPIMIYEAAPAQRIPGPDGIEVRMLDASASVADICENLTINLEGFASGEPLPSDDDALAFARLLSRARTFTVRLGGAGVAAAMMEAPMDGVTELVGVATLPAYRRRGIAAALVTHMAQQARALGVEVIFLRPVSDQSARIYARAGFAPLADVVTWVKGE